MSASESLSTSAPRAATGSYERLTSTAGSLMLAGVAFAAVLITHLIDFGSDNLGIGLLDANSDASWSHQVASGALAVATIVAGSTAWRSRRDRRLWGLTAGILAFLSVDELSTLHTTVDRLAWGKALYAPVLLILAVCVWRLATRGNDNLGLIVGLAVLFVSFGIHVFGPHVLDALGYGTKSWADQIKVALKQGTELAGWLLVFVGLSRLASTRELLR